MEQLKRLGRRLEKEAWKQITGHSGEFIDFYSEYSKRFFAERRQRIEELAAKLKDRQGQPSE